MQSHNGLRFRIHVALAILIFSAGAAYVTAATSEESDARAIKGLILKYAAAVNAEPVDIDVASQVWLHSAEDSLIFGFGEEHGWNEIKQNFYQNVMEAYFSERKLIIRDIAVHPYGDSAWAEFHWHFVAKSRKGGATVESNGVETQIYRKVDAGRWALVHVHYSAMGGTAVREP